MIIFIVHLPRDLNEFISNVIEFKCPYNFRRNDVMEYVVNSDSCFTGHHNQLKKEHRFK